MLKLCVAGAAGKMGNAIIREAAAKGRVPARKSGATWLIRRSDAESRWGERARKLVLSGTAAEGGRR